MTSIREVSKDIHLEDIIKQTDSNKVIVLNFWANWAPQCKQMKDVIEILAEDPTFANVLFFNIEAEIFPEISMQYAITAVPSCIMIKKSEIIGRVRGAHPSELRDQLTNCLATTINSVKTVTNNQTTTSDVEGDRKDLNSYLKKLVRSAAVMLFMKGTPAAPQCGFSRQIIQILKEYGLNFGTPNAQTFDILSDEEVRQGLKTFSNWPTFPQLYINGDLVGGLDIVKELAASGELKSMLPSLSPESQIPIEDRLQQLLASSRVLLFMKGSPSEPRCGFSRQIVSLLQETGCQFQHFDILSDEDVRQGLKTFSNWPTYPQLYVNSELIGGLDVVKELHETNELKSILSG